MARTDTSPSQQKPKVPGINIAGDYSVDGTDIAPDEQAALTPADAQHMEAKRQEVKRETLKGAQTQSTLGAQASQPGIVNPSRNSNVNTDWPVDE